MLYALGSNGSGQLGTGNNEDSHEPATCLLPADFKYTSILNIAAGGNHTLINTPGQIFAGGDMSNGRYALIQNTSKVESDDATRFSLSTVSSQFCAATWEASIIVDNINRIFSSGTGSKGELGLGEGVSSAARPTLIKNLPPSDDVDDPLVADLAAGMSHAVCLLTNGNVYAWGSGRKGQLGLPAVDCWSPRKITGIEFDPYRVACGKDFTYIVGAPESGSHMVLGNDRWGVVSQAPKTLPPWKSIGASWGSVFVLLENGELLSWGRNDKGQLGPPGLPKLAKMAVGSEHVVALTEDGRVLTWGWGEHGNCGQPVDADGDVKGRWNEIQVPGRVVGLGAGCATTFIVTEDTG